jgi:hypothetical protein
MVYPQVTDVMNGKEPIAEDFLATVFDSVNPMVLQAEAATEALMPTIGTFHVTVEATAATFVKNRTLFDTALNNED